MIRWLVCGLLASSCGMVWSLSNADFKRRLAARTSVRKYAISADGGIEAPAPASQALVQIGDVTESSIALDVLVEQSVSDQVVKDSKMADAALPMSALNCPSGKVCFFHVTEQVNGSAQTSAGLQVEVLDRTTRVKFFSKDITDMESPVALYIVQPKPGATSQVPKVLSELPDKYASQCGHGVVLHAVIDTTSAVQETQTADPDDPDDVTAVEKISDTDQVSMHSMSNNSFESDVENNGTQVKSSMTLAWKADQDLTNGSAFVVPVGTIVREIPLAKIMSILIDISQNEPIDSDTMAAICGQSTPDTMMQEVVERSPDGGELVEWVRKAVTYAVGGAFVGAGVFVCGASCVYAGCTGCLAGAKIAILGAGLIACGGDVVCSTQHHRHR